MLIGSEIPAAAAEVAAWGYPRELTSEDHRSLWTSPQPGFYAWLELRAEEDALHGFLHCAIRPDLQRRIYARPFLRGLRALGGSLRLDGLHVGAAGIELSPQLCQYLGRVGFGTSTVGFSIFYPR